MLKARNQAKTIILFHRSYRKLPGSLRSFLWQFILLAVPLAALTVFAYPFITSIICEKAKYFLAPYFPGASIQILSMPFIDSIGTIYFLDLPGSYPTIWFSLANTLICLLLLMVLLSLRSSKPSVIFLIIISSVHLISSLFFSFIPESFPYNVVDYSRLYMLQEINIWFFTPLIAGLGILPLPSGLTGKSLTILITYIYSLVFGAVRYVAFLYILAKASLIYMALLFFTFGPLADFVYIVGIYSIYVTRLANRIKDDFRLWKWQYLS